MGWAWARFRRETDPARVRAWIWMMIAALMTHPISDVFTTYGTQILVPFSNHRFAWDGIAIIDLFYSATLLFALAVGRRSGWASSASRRAAWAALLVTSAYMVYGVYLNQRAETLVRASLAEQGVHAGDVHAYPTLLQPYLRRIVVRVGDKVRVGWYDLWSHDQSEWTTIAVPRDPLIEALLLEPEGRIFAWFAMGQIVGSVVETQAGRRVEIDDLRYGWPGDARHGLWGIRAQYDRSGRRQGPIESFHRPRW
jgi:inner membrane protein